MKRRLLSVLLSMALIYTSADFTVFAREQILNQGENVTEDIEEDTKDLEMVSDDMESAAVEEAAVLNADGNIASGSYQSITWSIDGNGRLTVEGTGDFSNSTSYTRAPWYNYRDKIKSAIINVTGMTDASFMFDGCSGLTELDVTQFNTSQVTDMSNMFVGCSSLMELDVMKFDTSQVTDMSWMFQGCSSLTALDVTHFDTSQVTDMRNMFVGCSSLTALDVTRFDTSQVTDMHYMFADCSSLTALDVMKFDTSQVTDMSWMFRGCSSLTELDVTHFDTSQVTDMSNMFVGCSSLTELDVTHFDTSQVTDMRNIFVGCSSLTVLDVGNFDTNAIREFTFDNGLTGFIDGCTALTTIYTPINVSVSVVLPVANDSDTWYLSDGTVITGLPKNLDHSVLIKKNEIPDDEKSFIVDVVRRYTSQEEVEGYLALFEDLEKHYYSDEEAQKRIFEYFCCDNWSSVFEQITLLEDSHDERWAYNGLVTDEMYTAWQYQDYLNNTPKGQAARVFLFASGLVYNGELNAYLNPATYLDSDLPGIKDYKSMLKEFIGEKTAKIETYGYIKESEKFLKSMTNLGSDLEKEAVLKKLKKAGDKETCQSIFNNFVAEKIDLLGIEGTELNVINKGDTPKFIKALGITDDIFTITNVSVDFATQMADVSANIELYDTWHSFLMEISNATDLPWEMRAAAYQLDKEMEQTYLTPIQNVLNTVRDKCIDKVLDATVWKEVVSLGGYTKVLNLSADIINSFVDVGKLVVNSKKTEGYAYLANHYKAKLEHCKLAFLNNKSTENAWAFYEAYVMLYHLRVAGEEQFLKMNSLQGNDIVDGLSECATGGTIGGLLSDLCGYQDKKTCVDEILKRLKSFQFQFEMEIEDVPKEYQYLQKVVVKCPVSVEFLTADGISICKLEDKTEYDIENEYGHFKAFYNPAEGDYTKIGYFKTLNPVQVIAVGLEDGNVTYTQAVTDDNITCDITGFAKCKVETNEVITINTAEDTYVIDEKGDGKTVIKATKADVSKAFVQFDYDNGKTIEVVYADSEGKVVFPNKPQKENASFLGWYTEKDGKGDAFTEENLVTSNITVYAHWGEPKAVTGISLDHTALTLKDGETVTLTALITPDNASNQTVTWCSSKPEVAVVTNGIITALKEGMTEVTVTTEDGGKTASCTVTVFCNHMLIKVDAVEPDEVQEGSIEHYACSKCGRKFSDAEGLAEITDISMPESTQGLKVKLVSPNASYVYTGSAVKPAIIVTNHGRKLTEGVDYTIKYTNNVKASVKSAQNKKPKITVTGRGNLTGSTFTYFDILPVELKNATVAGTVVTSGAKASPVLLYNGIRLGNKDYEVKKAPKGQKYTTSGSMTLSGKGNFTGEINVPITVVQKADLKKFTVTLGREVLSYDGTEKKISFTVTDAKTKKSLKEYTDYMVVYPDNITDAGKVKFIVVGMGGYTGTVTKSYTIKPMAGSADSIKVSGLNATGYEYKSGGVTVNKDLVVTCQSGSKRVVLVEGQDYKVSYSNNKKVGTAAKYTISFMGNYKGTKAKTGNFIIKAAGLSNQTKGLQIVVADKVYTGKAGTYVSKPYVTVNGTILKPSDYIVTYYKDAGLTQEIKGNKNNISLAAGQNAVNVYIKVTGKGNYASENADVYATAQYQVQSKENVVDFSKAKVTFWDAEGKQVTKMEYTGKVLEPQVRVEVKEKGKNTYTCVDTSAYKVSYVNNISKGKATVVIMASGKGYVGSRTATFDITAKNLNGLTDFWKGLFK